MRGACEQGTPKHVKQNCPKCNQYITTAHVDLAYIGHADVTDRLLEVDPKWSWRPQFRDVPQDVLLAAMEAGPEILKMVMDNAPPRFDSNGGLWIWLFVHDDDGNTHQMAGYGDAPGKPYSGDAVKEVIGDALRNAAMRLGVALDLWSRADRSEAEAGNRQPEARTRTRRGRASEEAAETGPEVKAYADMAFVYAGPESGKSADDLFADVYEPVQKKRLLRAACESPFDGSESTLGRVIGVARALIEDR